MEALNAAAPLLKALLEHAGPVVTILFLMVGGMMFAAYKIAVKVGAFFDSLLQRRDETFSALARDIAEHNERSSVALATINTKVDALLSRGNRS